MLVWHTPPPNSLVLVPPSQILGEYTVQFLAPVPHKDGSAEPNDDSAIICAVQDSLHQNISNPSSICEQDKGT